MSQQEDPTMSQQEDPTITIEDIEMVDIPGGRLGYDITMSDVSKNIYLTISNSQHCCETYGVNTISGTRQYIGATYKSVDILEVSNCDDAMDEFSRQMTIKIHTDRGIMDITFYNQHNGYYSHDVMVQTEKGTYYESL